MNLKELLQGKVALVSMNSEMNEQAKKHVKKNGGSFFLFDDIQAVHKQLEKKKEEFHLIICDIKIGEKKSQDFLKFIDKLKDKQKPNIKSFYEVFPWLLEETEMLTPGTVAQHEIVLPTDFEQQFIKSDFELKVFQIIIKKDEFYQICDPLEFSEQGVSFSLPMIPDSEPIIFNEIEIYESGSKSKMKLEGEVIKRDIAYERFWIIEFKVGHSHIEQWNEFCLKRKENQDNITQYLEASSKG